MPNKDQNIPAGILLESAWTETARAKINLTLHVGTVAANGYHPLHSLVVFADFGDKLDAELAENFSLKLNGPFAKDTPGGKENLIVKSASVISDNNDVEMKLAYSLSKKLPVASGIGGGSADAAAALRLLSRANHVSWSEHAESFVAFGADVPVCFLSRTCFMEGIGEQIMPLPGLGQVPALLVNPGVSVSTKDIFEKFDNVGVSSDFNLPFGTLLDMARAGRNDLQAIATHVQPVISNVLAEIGVQEECQLARMSGSGATCFGLFSSQAKAKLAAKTIKKAHPEWWVRMTMLGDKT